MIAVKTRCQYNSRKKNLNTLPVTNSRLKKKSMLCTGNRMDLSELVRRWDFQLDVRLGKINNDSSSTRYTSSIPDELGAYT